MGKEPFVAASNRFGFRSFKEVTQLYFNSVEHYKSKIEIPSLKLEERMSNSEKSQMITVRQEAEEKVTVNFKNFCVVTDEPEKFVEKLDRLCQEHCDSSGDYFFNFGFSD